MYEVITLKCNSKQPMAVAFCFNKIVLSVWMSENERFKNNSRNEIY